MITRQQKQRSTQSSQFGFTIVESLMAIVVVTILMLAIAPVIVLSVGNRVQARRVELATQAARAYIDGIRSGTITPPNTTVELTTTQYFLDSVDAPTSTGSLTCITSTAGYPYCQNTSTLSLYCFDIDGGGCNTTSPKDLAIQAFRSVTSASTDPQTGYRLGLRVYRVNAFSDTTSLIRSNGGTKRTEATFTAGLGNRKAPLVEMTTEISTEQTRFRDLCARLGGCN